MAELNLPKERFIAVKINLLDLQESIYISAEDFSNYILSKNNQKIVRINNISTIIKKENKGNITNFILDDGSAQMTARFFENDPNLPKINVGDIILIIGKLRIYNQEKYISPEIFKRMDPFWLKARYLELNNPSLHQKESFSKKSNYLTTEETKKEQAKKEDFLSQNKLLNENKKKKKDLKKSIGTEGTESVLSLEKNSLPFEKIMNLIKDLDLGEGALIEEVLEKSLFNNTEEIIEKMLERGDIFQNQPGKIKLL